LSYDKHVKDARLFVTLITPSPSSFILSCLFASLVLLGSSWSALRAQPMLAPFLSGDYSFSRLLHDINEALSSVFSSDLSYNIAVIIFAALFGLCVYFTVVSIRRVVSDARITLQEIGYSDPRGKENLERSVVLRVGLRAATAFIWFCYLLLFLRVFLPLCASLVDKGSATASFSPTGSLLALVILLAGCHLHVIFARLLALRPRLFGLQDVLVGRGGH
jgi:hypothetical protein